MNGMGGDVYLVSLLELQAQLLDVSLEGGHVDLGRLVLLLQLLHPKVALLLDAGQFGAPARPPPLPAARRGPAARLQPRQQLLRLRQHRLVVRHLVLAARPGTTYHK